MEADFFESCALTYTRSLTCVCVCENLEIQGHQLMYFIAGPGLLGARPGQRRPAPGR